MTSTRLLVCVAVAVLARTVAAQIVPPSSILESPLLNGQAFCFAAAAGDHPSVEFGVDDAAALTFTITCSSPLVDFSITSPSGSVITPSTLAAVGGTTESITNDNAEPGMLIVPLMPPIGYTAYTIKLPSQGPGTYVLTIAPVGPPTAMMGTVSLESDSTIGAAMFGDVFPARVGVPASIFVTVADGQGVLPGRRSDVLVTIDSGLGLGSFATISSARPAGLSPNWYPLLDGEPDSKNHQVISSDDIAYFPVFTIVRDVERRKGNLR